MRRLLACGFAASLALTVAHGCVSSFGPGTPSDYDGGPLVLPLPDGGDGGDGGPDGGDGGPDGGDAGFDGGCVHTSFNGTAVDGCFSTTNQPQLLTVTESACSAFLSWSTGTCSGTFSGPNNAFSGACGSFGTCASSSIPGTITCDGGVTPCTIRVCAGSSCP